MGRGVRVIAGLALLYLFMTTLVDYADYVSLSLPSQPMRWLGVAFSFYFLTDVVNRGFSRTWGRWPQWIVVLLALAAIVVDFLQFESFWGPPLGLLIFVLLAYVTGHLGISFLLAGILSTPG
jgi:hypothetical protein